MTGNDRSDERSESGIDADDIDEASLETAAGNGDGSSGIDAAEPVDLTVESRAHGWRLDHYLTRIFGNHSRAQLQKAIDASQVTVNGLTVKPSRRLRVNDRIHVELQSADSERCFEAEDIPLDILYEDDAIVVVNKAAGMVVHPGRGTYSGTLAAALQFHFDQLSDIGGRHRPGIVHRLDRDTTGVILIAKNNQIHQRVSSQFEQREVKKEYRAIVRGVPELDADFIRTHVCVHNRVREKMMVCAPGGRSREAVTFYETKERFKGHALLAFHPHTGRTHQLRVHAQHIGTPIIADKQYIGEHHFTTGHLSGSPGKGEVLIGRQALHAFRLTISHPVSGKPITFEAPLPPDFQATLTALRS
ncbi:RluA family pseudouridine synthase [Fuerstiella marisgermanici]|uniref:Pseudouridine synthase n=1 Tax=Fuerstiella marisgermanici TaxID=1891926 RepID=A0A1P8WHI9_9PLAN|nr:RluA family pseudouridine synthase [Fuerstiella marisgermanici]APZ93531.1 Ribosomal large subunit pseudouridine synthase D [Fuerstiella marisgermanici]